MNEYTDILENSVNRLFHDIAENTANIDAWKQVEELGILNLFLPEDEGGMKGQWQDAAIVFRLCGYHAIPLPVGETMIARKVLRASECSIPTGPILISNHAAAELVRHTSSESLHLTGTVTVLGSALEGAHILATIKHDGHYVCVLLNSADADRSPPNSKTSKETQSVYHFKNTECSVVTGLDSANEVLLKYGAFLRTTQISGALIACLEKTVDYTSDRSQFGRPLSKFQVIQHQLALMTEEAAAVSSASAAAAIALEGSTSNFEISCAKLRANQAAGIVPGIAHQLHGAIGITEEYGLHRYTLRLWAWRSEFGNDRYWAQKIGKYVLTHSDESAWALITARGN